jgi:hypothetical protein
MSTPYPSQPRTSSPCCPPLARLGRFLVFVLPLVIRHQSFELESLRVLGKLCLRGPPQTAIRITVNPVGRRFAPARMYIWQLAWSVRGILGSRSWPGVKGVEVEEYVDDCLY